MTTDAVGGVWTYALDLARALARANVETMLVTLGPAPSADQVTDAYAIPRLHLVETGLPLDWLASEPAEVLEIGAAVRGLARGGRVHLIHLNSPALAAQGGFPAPVVGACHSCLATWWSAVGEGPMPDDFRWRTQLLWQGLHNCEALIAPTEAFARETTRSYEIASPQVIRNGREPPPSIVAGERQAIVFTTGRFWDGGKNIGVLDAAAGLCAAPVLAAGPLKGPNGAAVELRHAQALGRLSADEITEWLHRAAVFSSSAVYEPFGLGVLEAAQAGCALVLSDIPTFRELWDGTAVFVAADDAAGFAAAFDRLLANPAERLRLAAEARARSHSYTATRMASGVLDLYRKLQPRFALAGELAA
jgi:glycosyltransferase involved in cell wall biosynthesis